MKVVVLDVAASRSSQAAGTIDPALQRLVKELRACLALTEIECIGDILVACGLGDVVPDHVAACSARFTQAAAPRAIVFSNSRAEHLAARAGLLDGQQWAPAQGPIIPIATFAGDVDETAIDVGRILGIAPRKFQTLDRRPLIAMARELHAVLGEHRGSAVLVRGARNWRRTKIGSLRPRDVAAHLRGDLHVAPFYPKGPWPFVVIDVDRHNALQAESFDTTCRLVEKLFPNAFCVTSSASGGRHYYVRLPRDTQYEQGALVVDAFLAIRGARWLDERRVRSQAAEVPQQPVRLPFGEGSNVPDSHKQLEEQLAEFVKFSTSRRYADFHAADAAVRNRLRLRGRWSPEHREKIRRFLLGDAVGDAREVVFSSTDPWKPLSDLLPKPLRIVASRGVPAYGTRTRWTIELVKALSELVEPDKALDLMQYWIRHRDHVSEDIAIDADAVEEQTTRIVRDTYRAGVPIRAWQLVRDSIHSFFEQRRSKSIWWYGMASRYRHPEKLTYDDVRRTAFFVLKKFCDKGIKERPIGSREFARFGGKNRARDIEQLLTSEGRWLTFADHEVPGVRSRRYRLDPDLLPRRGEHLIYVPP